MNTLEIIVCIFTYLFFGVMASEGLIGNRTFYYEHFDSEFGPFNVFKGKTKNVYSEELEKKNVRRIMYFVFGGVFSYIFLIMYTIYSEIDRFIKTFKWAFITKKQ